MNVITIAQMLEEKGLGEVGRDIFAFSAPELAGECLLVLDNLEPRLRDEELPGYKKWRFRVIVRRMDYEAGEAVASDVIAALEMREGMLGSDHVKRLRAEYDPISYPLPLSDMIEFSVNFCAYYTEAGA